MKFSVLIFSRHERKVSSNEKKGAGHDVFLSPSSVNIWQY
jgi:hypothetical protein